MTIERLGDLCDIKIGRTPSRANSAYWNGSLPWATIADLGTSRVTETRESITETAVRVLKLSPVPAGTLLYSFKLTIGKMAFAGMPLYTNEAIAALTPKRPSTLDSTFLRFALSTIDAAAASSTAVKGRTLNGPSLANLAVPVPRIDLQRRMVASISDALTQIDNLRGGVLAQQAALSSLRDRVYTDAFRGQVPLTPSRSTELAPDGWSWHALTSLARLESGHTPSRSRPDWWGGDVPWIALPDIRRLDGAIATLTAESTNAAGIANSAARVLPEDTVVMSRTASVGCVTRMGRPMATSQDFVNWVCGPDLDPEFLMHLLIRSRTAVRALSSGATHKTVYFPTVQAFRVCIPVLSEQRRIARDLRAQLREIDALGDSLRLRRIAIGSMPAVLLRRAFDSIAT